MPKGNLHRRGSPEDKNQSINQLVVNMEYSCTLVRAVTNFMALYPLCGASCFHLAYLDSEFTNKPNHSRLLCYQRRVWLMWFISAVKVALIPPEAAVLFQAYSRFSQENTRLFFPLFIKSTLAPIRSYLIVLRFLIRA